MQEVQDQYMQKEIENKQKKEVKPIEPVTENKVENENKVDSTTSNVKEEESKEEDKKEEDKKEIIEETEKSEDRKRPHSHFILQTSEDEKDQEEDENRYIDPEVYFCMRELIEQTGEKWIRCQNPFCGKWRFVPDEVEMPTQNPWFCILNNWDEGTASCSYPQLTEGYIVVKKKEEPEKEWMPKRECHFEKITPLTYQLVEQTQYCILFGLINS